MGGDTEGGRERGIDKRAEGEGWCLQTFASEGGFLSTASEGLLRYLLVL